MKNEKSKFLVPQCLSALAPYKKNAFTLAEVLITLAIIGVVAAMTIPTLVANYQEKSWGTAATVFERKLEEALKVMNTQSTLVGHSSTENFVEELSKHLKITKTCANDKLMDCFSETVFWGNDAEEVDMSKIKTAKDFGQNDWNTNIIGAQFANGVTGLIAYNPTESCKQDPYSNQIVGTGCLAILYDTTGYKTPNTSLKDLRALNVFKLGSEIACIEDESGLCWSAYFMPTPLSYDECLQYQDELSVPCVNGADTSTDIPNVDGRDYWVGALKACKDQGGRLPSKEDIKNLGNTLYLGQMTLQSDEENGGFMYFCENNSVCWNQTKADELALNNVSMDEANLPDFIWTSDIATVVANEGFISAGGFFSNGYGVSTVPFMYPLGARCIFD